MRLASWPEVRRRHGYLLDPHSAVGWLALERYLAGPGDPGRPSLLAATAHPGKFSEAIRAATGEEVEIPRALAAALARPKQAIPIVARGAARVPARHRVIRRRGEREQPRRRRLNGFAGRRWRRQLHRRRRSR